MTDYKFREDELIEEFKTYIDSTYKGHYGQGGLQSSEIIVDRGHGMGFFSGNIDKYNDRYGKKGDGPKDWRKDILKTIHYGFLKLFEHDRLYGVEGYEENVLLDGIRIGDIPSITLKDPLRDPTQTELDLPYPDDYIKNGGTITIDDDHLSLLFPTTTLDKEHKRLNDATPEEWDRATKKRKTNV